MIRNGFPLLLSIVVVSSICSIGIGLAYTASVENSHTIDSDYCTIFAGINGNLVEEISVLSNEPSILGFRSNGIESQTLSLNYFHTRGTDIVLTIGFSSTTASETPIIRCLDSDGIVVGSTLLVGEGSKAGTISGIVLPLSGNNSDTIDFTFQVDGISAGTLVQMSLSVHPLEVSS